jgi:hypothetical protein
MEVGKMNEDTVRELARAADLPLADDRPPLIATQLATWLEAANELSRKLAGPEHQTELPITAFTHHGHEGSEQ